MAKNDKGFPPELLDELLAGRDPKSVLDSDGLIGELKKAIAERMLNAEMDVHLANEAGAGLANHRNGSNPRTLLTPEGSLELSTPRDRHGRFDPALIAKYRAPASPSTPLCSHCPDILPATSRFVVLLSYNFSYNFESNLLIY
jgi:putative transposase